MTPKKVALITGGSAGIGRASAILFKQNGYEVYAGARRTGQMADLADMGIHVISLDVTDRAANRAAVDRILEEQGRIDVLINSAGYGSFGAAEDVPLDEAKRQLDVNLFGAADLTQLILPAMRRQRAGRIINISSTGGRMYLPLGAWYVASKHALEAYTDSLRLEVKSFGIHPIIIEPGGTATEWQQVTNDRLLASTPQESVYRPLAERFASISQGGFMTAEQVARVIYKSAVAAKPKHRYVPGVGNRALMFVIKHASTPLIDRLMGQLMNRMSKA
ncbi:oxidoreductase [Paenibacillus protaetiae]|uniref:SDR family NAD(P)-dependent oxidoreductase n=1 Tax=Paenibacillus protaetiae TaxID=2509456 RepID=A0A4P6ESE7_9BACL|nr:oxidoreductase [Paenibacillus protaetiae]QAY65814.1 SDR family NAD(P)-dependent oxidoreductase [Paenibacillus protaetiae]